MNVHLRFSILRVLPAVRASESPWRGEAAVVAEWWDIRMTNGIEGRLEGGGGGALRQGVHTAEPGCRRLVVVWGNNGVALTVNGASAMQEVDRG